MISKRTGIGKRAWLVFRACIAAACVSVPAAAAEVAGKVDNMRLDASTAVYSYVNGVVRRDGVPLGPESAAEAERAKRLALFSLWLERDPFFFSHPAPAGLGEAVARLTKLNHDLLESLAPGEKIYPVGFLGAYAAASAAYPEFSAAPSASAAAGFLDKMELAVKNYAAEADSISSSVAKRFEASKIDRLAGLGGGNYTDRHTVLSDFGLIRKNAAAATARLDALRKCLSDSSSYCRPAWPAARTAAEPSPPASRPRILPMSDLGLEGKAVGGPYLVETSCWQGLKENYFFYSERCEPDGMCLDWSYLATDMIFRKIDSNSPTHQKMRHAGLRLEAVSATTLYACPDKAYLATLKALDSFTKRYQGNSAFAGLDQASLPPSASSSAKAARKAEDAFFAEKYKTQRAMERLAGAYQGVLGALDPVDVPLKAELLDRVRLLTLRTEYLPQLFNRVVFHVSIFNRRIRAIMSGRTDLDPLVKTGGLFMSRNFYSLMFMPYSPTVWRLRENPVYVRGHLPESEMRYFGYNEAVKLYGREEVGKAVRLSDDKRAEIVMEHFKEK